MLNILESDTKDFQKVVNNILIEVKPMRLRGKISDDFLGYVNELRQQLTDLEAKLAESEKLKDDAMYNLAWLNQDLSDTKEQLKVEKDAFKVLSDNYNTLSSAYDQLKQQLEDEKYKTGELCSLIDVMRYDDPKIDELEKKLEQSKMNESFEKEKKDNALKLVSELQQQLTEKDAEIEKLKIILSVQAVQAPEEQRVNLITANCVQYNPNQTAIAKLEKVKEYIVTDEKDMFGMPYLMKSEYILEFIDQQIKSLKGEK